MPLISACFSWLAGSAGNFPPLPACNSQAGKQSGKPPALSSLREPLEQAPALFLFFYITGLTRCILRKLPTVDERG